MFPVLLGVAAAVGIAAWLSSESDSLEQEWYARKGDLSNEIVKQSERVRRYQNNAEQNVQFYHLVNEHHKSVQMGNAAYQLLNNCSLLIKHHWEAIQKIKQHRNLLKAQLAGCDHAEKQNIFAELRTLKAPLDDLYQDLAKYQAEKKEFLDNVQNLNAATRALKLMIRDTTGQKGRDWYAKLEARKRLS